MVSVTCQYSTQEPLDGSTLGVLVVSGLYKRGSQGNEDADFILSHIQEALAKPGQKGLLVDCTAMHYEWGNTILNAFALLRHASIPCVVIYSSQCQGMVAAQDPLFYDNQPEGLAMLVNTLAAG